MPDKLIKRDVYYKVKEILDSSLRIPILVGPRRVGKSTILNQLKQKYNDSVVISMDDPIFSSLKTIEILLILNN